MTVEVPSLFSVMLWCVGVFGFFFGGVLRFEVEGSGEGYFYLRCYAIPP